MLVTYNITINSSWVGNFSSRNIIIIINGNSVNSSSIVLAPHPLNYINAYTILPGGLTSNDSIVIYFDSFWNLNSAEGYHNTWDVAAGYQI